MNEPLYMQVKELDNSITAVHRKLDALFTLGEEPELFAEWLVPYRVVDTRKAALFVQIIMAKVYIKMCDILRNDPALSSVISEAERIPIEFMPLFIEEFTKMIDECESDDVVEILWGIQRLKEDTNEAHG